MSHQAPSLIWYQKYSYKSSSRTFLAIAKQIELSLINMQLIKYLQKEHGESSKDWREMYMKMHPLLIDMWQKKHIIFLYKSQFHRA